jgi:endonuclease/exonuclease/phosphatase family metal-dependent hydrolase
MKRLLYLLYPAACCLLLTACNNSPHELRVMTFNIWVGGGTSLAETARVIRESRADIIGIQESADRDRHNRAIALADSLGLYAYENGESATILSRYAIVATSEASYGVKLQLDKTRFVWMFNTHLFHCPYEPYQLSGIEYCGAPPLATPEETVASAWNTRGETVLALIADIQTAQKEGFPVFLTGDFNEPSCLDWTERAAKAGLCPCAVAWPATKTFIEQAHMQDSYRTIYRNEVTHPGHTWTPRPAQHEILDRIDFVFFWGNVRPVKSEVAGEAGPFSDLCFDNYPSDHRAVISTFEWSRSD